MLEKRTFNKVHFTWLNLMDKLERDHVIDRWAIDKVYKDEDMVDISCWVNENMLELFDNIVFR